MRPTRLRDLSKLKQKSRIEIFNDDFRPTEVEQSIAHLREENAKLRWIAATLERQTKMMRAAAEKPKPPLRVRYFEE